MFKLIIAMVITATMMVGNANALTLWFGDATSPSNGYYVFDNNIYNPDSVIVPFGAQILQDTNPTAGAVQYQGSFNGFDFLLTSGLSKPLTGNTNTAALHLTSIEATYTGSGTKTLEIYLTDTGFTIPLLNTIPNALATSAIGGVTQGTVTYNGFIDPSNTGSIWGGELIDAGTFTSQAFSSNKDLNVLLSGAFALTEGVSITHSLAGQSTSVDWIVSATPVPEPGTMMLLSFGIFGLAIFGKRKLNKEA